ncbi:MAG: hypothetical protein WCO61_02505 [Alphaproteobacteria bacterium]
MLRQVLAFVIAAGLGLSSVAVRASDDPVAQLDTLILAKDFDNAVKLAREAAEAGNVEVQFRLGLFFWHGVGLTQNYLEALRWTTLAALAGHEKAFAARKLMLPSVDAPNWPKVLDWCRQRLQKNAETGFNPALFAMAKSYSPDFGFENSVEEYYWASLAVAIGDTAARKRRDELTKKLAVTDAAKAQDRAAAWIEKFRSGKPPG